jgi:hypothetical protein
MLPTLLRAAEAFKTRLAQELRNHPEDIINTDELDEQIHLLRTRLGAITLCEFIHAAGCQVAAESRVCRCGGTLTISHRPSFTIHSAQGVHDATGVALKCGRCKCTCRPVHNRLGIRGQHHVTVLLEELAADFFLDRGSPTAAKRMRRHHGVDVGRTTVLRHSESCAADAQEYTNHKLAAAVEQAHEPRDRRQVNNTVLTQMDSSSGKVVDPLKRPAANEEDVELTPVRGLAKTTRLMYGRQVKLICAQAPGEASWNYYSYVGDFEDAIAPLQGLAATRGWQPGVKAVMTADGEKKIREVAEGAFAPNLQVILDRPHAVSHLNDVPDHAGPLLPSSREAWIQQSKDKLHAGRVMEVVREIRSIAARMPESKGRTKVDNVAEYFSTRSDAVHYDRFKSQDWPIASGVVEGGHASIVHPISKRGVGWRVENLSGVTALACLRANDWWDEYWRDRRRRMSVAA